MLCVGLPILACLLAYPIHYSAADMCEAIECVDINERNMFIDYVSKLEVLGYRLGGDGDNGEYDCTGIIFSYFKNEVSISKPSTQNFYSYGLMHNRFVTIDKVEPGDLVVMIKKDGGKRPNHTAVITSVVDSRHVEIIDSFLLHTKTSKRVIPMDTPDHKIYLVKNPFLMNESELIPF